MALILHIDTATTTASVCLSEDEKVLAFAENEVLNNHASFLQPAIQNIIDSCKLKLTDIDAIAVTNGPGSYTGLRVSLASAKGLCYALNKPLIALNTLKVMASAFIENGDYTNIINKDNFLICPMIDARRMEVFTALYDRKLSELTSSYALILQENSFHDELEEYEIVFCGNGSEKFKNINNHKNAVYFNHKYSAKNMINLSLEIFHKKNFEDLTYSKPNYGKEFYSTMKTDD